MKKITQFLKSLFTFSIVQISVIIGLLIITVTFIYSKSKPDINKELKTDYKNNYSVYMLQIPGNVNFAGEKVPLENFDTYENFDKELHINTYWHSQTFLFFKRANRYFPVIEKILKKNNIPDDFKFLALIESGLTNITSPANAVGFWQFLKGTAGDYGLIVNDEIDERYNLEKSTQAACDYFNKSFSKFNSWTMVAASYNIGRNNLLKQINRQKTDYYYDLLLGEETERYVFRILALKYIFNNPQDYGFNFNKKDLYKPIPHYYVKIDSTIADFADFAMKYSTNYKVLKILNPWLRDNHLTNSYKKEYIIKIPRKGYRTINLEHILPDDSLPYK